MKHITDAYTRVHGEWIDGNLSIATYLANQDYFRSGWACALAWKEEQEDEICDMCGAGLDNTGCCTNNNCEMLEIEKDVLYQQKEITK